MFFFNSCWIFCSVCVSTTLRWRRKQLKKGFFSPLSSSISFPPPSFILMTCVVVITMCVCVCLPSLPPTKEVSVKRATFFGAPGITFLAKIKKMWIKARWACWGRRSSFPLQKNHHTVIIIIIIILTLSSSSSSSYCHHHLYHHHTVIIISTIIFIIISINIFIIIILSSLSPSSS